MHVFLFFQIIQTLRRCSASISREENSLTKTNDVTTSTKDEIDDVASTLQSGVPPFQIHVPPEQYFLTPDPNLSFGQIFSQKPGAYASSNSSSDSSSSSDASSISVSPPTSSNRKCLSPEEAKARGKTRRRRTIMAVCFGILGIALIALAIGVTLHFLLKEGIIGTNEILIGKNEQIGMNDEKMMDANSRLSKV